MSANQLIGEKISSLRSLKNIPLKDLSAKAGLSENQLKLIESGQSIPSLGVLIRITRALGVRIGTLLDDSAKEGPAVMRENGHKSTISFSTNENESREHLNFLSLAPNKAGRHMEPFMVEIIPNKNKDVKSSH